MTPRNFASVTEIDCECGYLEDAANDPDSPIVFDELTGEYQLQFHQPNPTRWQRLLSVIWKPAPPETFLFYHCPFCGGAAPESRRHLLFEAIPTDEELRLAELLKSVTTIDAAIAAFGPPEMDSYMAVHTAEAHGQPPALEHRRHIRYHQLSKVAEVWITERADGTATWQLQGKLKQDVAEVGPPKS